MSFQVPVLEIILTGISVFLITALLIFVLRDFYCLADPEAEISEEQKEKPKVDASFMTTTDANPSQQSETLPSAMGRNAARKKVDSNVVQAKTKVYALCTIIFALLASTFFLIDHIFHFEETKGMHRSHYVLSLSNLVSAVMMALAKFCLLMVLLHRLHTVFANSVLAPRPFDTKFVVWLVIIGIVVGLSPFLIFSVVLEAQGIDSSNLDWAAWLASGYLLADMIASIYVVRLFVVKLIRLYRMLAVDSKGGTEVLVETAALNAIASAVIVVSTMIFNMGGIVPFVLSKRSNLGVALPSLDNLVNSYALIMTVPIPTGKFLYNLMCGCCHRRTVTRCQEKASKNESYFPGFVSKLDDCFCSCCEAKAGN